MGSCSRTKGFHPAVWFRVRCHIEGQEGLTSFFFGVAYLPTKGKGGIFIFKINKRIIPVLAMLVAVSIIFTRAFGVMVPIAGAMTLRLSFGEIPIILAGVLFGPLAGFMTGIAADLLGYLINSFGAPYFPGLTLSAGLVGLLPGLLLRNVNTVITFRRLLAVIAATSILISISLDTYWLSVLFKVPYLALLPARTIARLLLIPVYTLVIHTVISRSFVASLREHQA